MLMLLLVGVGSVATAQNPKYRHKYTVAQARLAAQSGALFIDVRNPDELALIAFDVQHIVNLPLDSLESHLSEIPVDRQVILVCRSGRRTDAAYAVTAGHGLKNIGKMKGGMLAWQAAGYPTTTAQE